MPSEAARPVVNLFHSRLILAVDWFRAVDGSELYKPSPSAGDDPPHSEQCAINSVYSFFSIAELFAVAIKRSLAPADHDSYTKYVAAIYQKQQAALAAQQLQPGGANRDNRVGLNIEHLLRLVVQILTGPCLCSLPSCLPSSKFVGVEELEEYYCECCRKLCPGVVHTSIHTLPDVLILHLKRLVMNATGGGKIRTLVKFPLVDLDMCPYTTGGRQIYYLRPAWPSSDYLCRSSLYQNTWTKCRSATPQ